MKMKETEYLLSVLEGWSKLFSGIHIRYAYDEAAEYHVVEIDPESVRRGDAGYKMEELQLYLNFMNRFPQSCLLIAKPCEAYDMTNILYESVKCYVYCQSEQTCESMNYGRVLQNIDFMNGDCYTMPQSISFKDNNINMALAA